MYSASDLRKGLKVEIDGAPYIITDFQFSKPGKGQALYNCKMKNIITGSTLSRTYRSNDKLDKPNLMERDLQFSYVDGDSYVFMNEDYEQISVPAEIVGDGRNFLLEDAEVAVLFYNDAPVEVTVQNFVEVEIVETEPGFKGNTATNTLKPAKIVTGYVVQVPLFINEGDLVRIDTRTGEYMDRVRK